MSEGDDMGQEYTHSRMTSERDLRAGRLVLLGGYCGVWGYKEDFWCVIVRHRPAMVTTHIHLTCVPVEELETASRPRTYYVMRRGLITRDAEWGNS